MLGLTLPFREGVWTHANLLQFNSLGAELQGMLPDAALVDVAAWGEEGRRSRIELRGRYLIGLLIVPVMDRDADHTWYRRILVAATTDAVLTVEDAPPERGPLDLTGLVDHVRACPTQRPGDVVAVLIDEVAGSFSELVNDFEAEVDEIEAKLDGTRPHRASDGVEFRNRLRDFRHDLHDARAALGPLSEAVHFIVTGEDLKGTELFPSDIEHRLRDTHDQLRYVAESLDVIRDELGGLRDYLQSRIANEQNEIMKTLTIVAALVLVPTFIVGFYGQNFDNLPVRTQRLGFWGG